MSTAAGIPALPGYAGRLLAWRTAALTSLAVALWVAMAEIDRLIAATVADGGGASRTAGGLQSLEAQARRDSWPIWREAAPGPASELPHYLQAYAVADALFALAYFSILWRPLRPYRWLRGLLVLELACELGESVTLAYLASRLPDAGPSWILMVLAYAKWSLLALLAVSVLYYRVLRRLLSRWLRRTAQALLFQRLSLFPVLAVAAMALLPIPGVSDQLPDAQRSWAREGFGAPHWWLAVLVVAAGTAGLFVLGRRRSELAWALHVSQDAKLPAVIGWWAYGPALLVAGLILAALFGRLPQPPTLWMLAFLSVPLAVVVLSVIGKRHRPSFPPPPWPHDLQRAVSAWRCGDVLACSFLVVSGAALVRSFTAPAVLGLAGGRLDAYGWSGLFFAAGGLAVLGAFPLMAFLIRATWPAVSGTSLAGLLDPRVPSSPAATTASRISLVAAAVVLALLLAFPSGASRLLGIPATAVVSVLAWTVVVGFLVVQLQQQRAIWVFEKVGLRANPIVSLILFTLLVSSLNGGDARIHALREAPEQADGTARPTVQEYVKQRLAASPGCTVATTLPDGSHVPVRPVVFVAAEGGGIRAAAWTAAALQELSRIPCGREAVLLSSGVSGGSLGLVVTKLYSAEGESAVDVVAGLARPDALAAGVAGALVGDLVAAGTNLLVGSGPVTESGAGWQDRAGVMEQAWERSAGRLAQPWEPASAGTSLTGALVLNSTASGIGCRLLISQLDLAGDAAGRGQTIHDAEQPPPGVTPRIEDCRERPVPLSIDLLAHDACPLRLSWATAAMLSARFPIISPAGRVPYPADDGCSPANAYQAIDGGYSEGSGLGTIHDLWPAFRDALQSHNTAATDSDPVVVPVFLFLQNSVGSDVVAGPPELAGELAVPLVGISAKTLQSEATSWMQRLDGAAGVCDTGSTRCQDAQAAFARSVDGPSIRVAPASRPSLDPPLGWSLSPFSLKRLDQAMQDQAACEGSTGECPAFAKLLQALRR